MRTISWLAASLFAHAFLFACLHVAFSTDRPQKATARLPPVMPAPVEAPHVLPVLAAPVRTLNVPATVEGVHVLAPPPEPLSVSLEKAWMALPHPR